MANLKLMDVFQATDLQRQAGKVLDAAEQRPVLITRNGATFVLVHQDKLSDLVDRVFDAGKEIARFQDSRLNTIRPGMSADDVARVRSEIQRLAGKEAGDGK